MKNNLPLILTNNQSSLNKNLSEINFDTSNNNSFGQRFSRLKQLYLSSNIKTIKKSTSQNSYTYNTNPQGVNYPLNEDLDSNQNEEEENNKNEGNEEDENDDNKNDVSEEEMIEQETK